MRNAYFPSSSLWVLNPDFVGSNDLRYCTFTATRDLLGGAHLSINVQRKDTGAPIETLFESQGFLASLDQCFEDVLFQAIPFRMPSKYQKYLAHRKVGGSAKHDPPVLNFSLPYELRDIFEVLSSHEALAIASAFAQLCGSDHHVG